MFDFNMDDSWKAVRRVYRNNVHPSAKINPLKRRYQEAKQPLLQLFDSTGRLELPVTEKVYMLDALAKAQGAAEEYINKSYTGNDFPYATMIHMKKLLSTVFRSVSCEEIAENKIRQIDDPRPKYAGKKLNNVRAGVYVKYLFENQPAPLCTDACINIAVTALSIATTHLKQPVTSKIVLSVNPLDMIMASEHTTGWTSCHALKGSRATGPMSFLLDGSSMIAYVYNNVDRYEPADGLILPKKIWRQMVFVQDQLAVLSRAFPAANDICTHHVYEAVKKLWGIEDDLRVEDKFKASYKIAFHNEWAYRDAVTSAVCNDNTAIVNVGSSSIPCLACGTDRVQGSTGAFLCSPCGGHNYVCSRCQDSSDDEDFLIEGLRDDVYYCESCWNELFATCAGCGDTVSREDLQMTPSHVFDFYCDTCWHEKFFICDYCDEAHWLDDLVTFDDSAYCTSCADDLLTVCGVCDTTVRRRSVTRVGDSYYCRQHIEQAIGELELEEEEV